MSRPDPDIVFAAFTGTAEEAPDAPFLCAPPPPGRGQDLVRGCCVIAHHRVIAEHFLDLFQPLAYPFNGWGFEDLADAGLWPGQPMLRAPAV